MRKLYRAILIICLVAICAMGMGGVQAMAQPAPVKETGEVTNGQKEESIGTGSFLPYKALELRNTGEGGKGYGEVAHIKVDSITYGQHPKRRDGTQ